MSYTTFNPNALQPVRCWHEVCALINATRHPLAGKEIFSWHKLKLMNGR